MIAGKSLRDQVRWIRWLRYASYVVFGHKSFSGCFHLSDWVLFSTSSLKHMFRHLLLPSWGKYGLLLAGFISFWWHPTDLMVSTATSQMVIRPFSIQLSSSLQRFQRLLTCIFFSQSWRFFDNIFYTPCSFIKCNSDLNLLLYE